MLGAIVAGGASLVGGLLDNKKADKAANTAFRYQVDLNNQALHSQHVLLTTQNQEVGKLNDRVDAFNRDILANHSTNETRQTDETFSTGSIEFKRLVADAEAAGFNPLTVLRAGGFAGYSTSNVRTTSTLTQKVARDLMTYFAPSQAPQAQHPGSAPIPQYTPTFSNAINAGLAAWQTSNQNRFTAERQRLEQELVKAQIGNLNSDTQLNRYRLTPPSYTGSGRRTTSGGFGGAVKGVLGAPATPTPGEVKVTNPFPTQSGWVVNPGLLDAAAWEERIGEIGASFVGLGNLVADMGTNVVRTYPNSATGKVVTAATDAAKPYFRQAYDAMVRAWNSPAWNAK